MLNLPISQCWLEVPIEPPTSTHQAALRILKTRDGRQFVGKMKNNKITNWSKQFALHLQKPEKPMEGPVRVYIRLYYTPPKYLLPKINKCKILVKTTKPDVDNVVKAILDEFTKFEYWVDDSQVWAITVEKYWAAQPRVAVYIDQNQQPTTHE
jgi:Holliday junction resolvase RusA-like endonuclease